MRAAGILLRCVTQVPDYDQGWRTNSNVIKLLYLNVSTVVTTKRKRPASFWGYLVRIVNQLQDDPGVISGKVLTLQVVTIMANHVGP